MSCSRIVPKEWTMHERRNALSMTHCAPSSTRNLWRNMSNKSLNSFYFQFTHCFFSLFESNFTFTSLYPKRHWVCCVFHMRRSCTDIISCVVYKWLKLHHLNKAFENWSEFTAVLWIVKSKCHCGDKIFSNCWYCWNHMFTENFLVTFQ